VARRRLGRACLAALWLVMPAWLLVPGSASAAGADRPAASATPPAPDWREFPFAQKLDMRVIAEVLRSPPDRLLAAMARHEVDVRLVRTEAAPDRRPNPLLAALPPAPAELLQQAEFRESYEGRVVLRGTAPCNLPRDTLLIRDTASTYTLLHEFVQSRLVPGNECIDDAEIELRFAVDYRRLQLYQRRLYDDPFKLLDPQWRADILAAQAAVAERLFRRIQIGQSQEAIVEKVLAAAIDERSPYFDAARRAQGRRYGELMIDNAVDLFNDVHGAIAFVRETVGHLREEVRVGRIEPAAPLGLSQAEAAAFDDAAAVLAQSLARVRAAIGELKQFYVR